MPHAYDIVAQALHRLDPRGWQAFLYLRRLPRQDRRYFLASYVRALASQAHPSPYRHANALAALVGGI